MKRLLHRSVATAAACLPVLLLAGAAFAQTAAPGAAPATAVAPAAAAAAEVAKIDTGDTAWMLTSTALVLMMTVPGLALFYAGMVRKKNVLATLMQSFAICCLITIVWMVAGYSLTFTNGSGATAPFIGDLSRFFLNGIGEHIAKGVDTPFVLGAGSDNATTYTIPESVYMMYQMTFAIITPALIAGAFADRMKFSAMCVFMVLWVADRLLPDRPFGVERHRLCGGHDRRDRLRGRHGGAHQRGDRRAGLCARAGQAGRLRARQYVAVQSDLRRDRRLPAVGGLVRLQRRVGSGCGWTRRHGDDGHPDRHPREPRWRGCSPSGPPRANLRCWA